jgi:LysM repeat protein
MNSPQGRRPAESPSCPLLGLPDDPSTRFSYPSVAHRCRATDRPRPIELGHQAAFCLAATYPECPRYQAAAAPRRSDGDKPKPRQIASTDGDSAGVERATVETGAVGPSVPPSDVDARPTPSGAGRMPWSLDRPGDAGATVLVQPSAPPHRPDRTDPPGRTQWRRVVIVVIAIVVLTMLAGAAYLASPAIGDWMRQVGAGVSAPSPSPIPSSSATPTPTPTPAPPTPSPNPTPTPGPTSTPGPSATTTAAPTPARTSFVHDVAKGETLIGIAARYGVPVEAIIRANGLKDPGLIYVGERLVIPPP